MLRRSCCRCCLRQFTSLNQFVDVVVGGEHSWILEILKFFAFNERLLAVNAILAVLGGPHVLEESQDVRIIRCGLTQFVQFTENDGKLGIKSQCFMRTVYSYTQQRTCCILLGSREYSPTQLRGHKIAVGGILCGIRIHQANELLATTLLLRVEFQLGKYRVKA